MKPVILTCELFKFYCKVREYFKLVRQEKLGVYYSREEYMRLMEEKEQAKSLINMKRSAGKSIPKSIDFQMSDTFKDIVKKSTNKPEQSQVKRQQLEVSWLQKMKVTLTHPKSPFKCIELLKLCRPVVYILSLWKLGERTYKPVIISAVVEIIILALMF